jgi:predicted DNA-binding transcriptional regulator YafY
MANSHLRLLQIAQMLPMYPHSKTAKKIRQSLKEIGQDVRTRTLQRDLLELMDFQELNIRTTPPTGPGREGPGYCYSRGAKTLGPEMDVSTALTLVMANEYATKLMPEEVVDAMRPFIGQAQSSLSSRHKRAHASWKKKVRSVPRYLCFQKPKIAKGIYNTVTDALFNDHCIEITYKEREKPYFLHPLALVDRGLETILVAYVQEYGEHRQFMLHRIRTITSTTMSVRRPRDFDIDQLIEDSYFSVPLDNKKNPDIKLEVRLFEQDGITSVIMDISGTPLSADQKLTLAKDEKSALVKATVKDTQELRAWLLGLGARAEVVKPAYLRRHMAEVARGMNESYLN